ncbi:N-terminal domain of NEFA-interacting nuclear protein NIP30-domain-containing protein [Cladochytrium replicatum]|nr:N-terminal domain of NEFA-interacting nuclear protein NIP30-domain-containing protein [Cladochytrium replicatum]
MDAQLSSKFVSKAVLIDENIEERTATDQVKTGEAYDPRPLFERLQQQKQLKEDEFTEKTKLGNLIKKLDEDEVEFLAQQQRNALEERQRIAEEEQDELNEFRRAVAGERSATSQPVKVAPSVHSLPPKKAHGAGVSGIAKAKLQSSGLSNKPVLVVKKRKDVEATEGTQTNKKQKAEPTTEQRSTSVPSIVSKNVAPAKEATPKSSSLSLIAGYSDDDDSS